MVETLEIRRLCSSIWLTDGATRNTSGIEWSSDHTLTVYGTRRSEVLAIAPFKAAKLGETTVNYSPSVSLDGCINETGFGITLIRNLDGRPGGIETFEFTAGTDAVGVQLSIDQFGSEDGVLVVASRRGVVERWIIRQSLVDRLVIDAGAGNDYVSCGAAFDDNGEETILPAVLMGGAGDDTIVTAGDATLSGGAGNDVLATTGVANLVLNGGRGDDYIAVSDDTAKIDGGAGFDRVNASAERFEKTGIEGIAQP